MSGPLVAVTVYLAFTGLFAVFFMYGAMRASAKDWPERTDILTDEERAQWDQIERHWL